jgi:hypothetical protein
MSEEEKPKEPKKKKRRSGPRRSPRDRDVKLTAFALAMALGGNDEAKRNQAREVLIRENCLRKGYNNLLTATALYLTRKFHLSDDVEISEIRSWISQENTKIKSFNENQANKRVTNFKSRTLIPSLKDKLAAPTAEDVVAKQTAEANHIKELLDTFLS